MKKTKQNKKKLACLKIINNYTVTTQTKRKYAKTIKKNKDFDLKCENGNCIGDNPSSIID